MSRQKDIPRLVKVLLVDDGQVEEVLFRNIFDRSPALHLIHVAKDGREAMEFLRREGPFRNVRQPDLVLLDIYMPLKDGFEVLRDMRSDPVLRKIPVIMLTSSGSGEDVNRAYEEGANTFITKPSDVDRLKKTIQLFADYWSETAQLPSTS
jgi:CheY-like chemotaxis protein